jgi:hypothetical protein
VSNSEPQITDADHMLAERLIDECGPFTNQPDVYDMGAEIIAKHMAEEREQHETALNAVQNLVREQQRLLDIIDAADALSNTAEALIKNLCGIDQLEESLDAYRKATS